MSRILLVIGILMLAALPVLAQTDGGKIMPPVPSPAPAPISHDPSVVNVTGECVRQVTPDRALLTATANYQDPKSVQAASKFVMTQYEQFNTAVKAMGLKDMTIQTADYNVNPIYQWVQPDSNKPGKQVLQGYQARLGLSVKTSSIDRMGDVIAKAGEIGIAEVGGFQLMLSDEASRQIRSECLSEAVQNARVKAQKMAEAAGGKLGKVLSVSEGYAAPVQPMFANRAMMKGAESDAVAVQSPTIQAGATTIQVNITAAFEIN